MPTTPETPNVEPMPSANPTIEPTLMPTTPSTEQDSSVSEDNQTNNGVQQ